MIGFVYSINHLTVFYNGVSNRRLWELNWPIKGSYQAHEQLVQERLLGGGG